MSRLICFISWNAFRISGRRRVNSQRHLTEVKALNSAYASASRQLGSPQALDELLLLQLAIGLPTMVGTPVASADVTVPEAAKS